MERELSPKEVLLFQVDDNWNQVEVATKEITSEEFSYKPVPKALGPEAALEEPMPQGVSTIGFKIAHMTITGLEVVNALKGKGSFSLKDFAKKAPKNFPEWMELLKETHRSFRQSILDSPEDRLTENLKIWGNDFPLWKVIIWIADHYSWHAGQIRTLRAHFEQKVQG